MYSRSLKTAFATIALVSVYVLAQAAWSQTPTPPAMSDTVAEMPRFDVISVRETRSPLMSERNTGDGYLGEGNFLSTLIMGAYGIPVFDRIVGLPTWYRDRRFDIMAKVDPVDIAALQKLTYVQRRSMFRQILEERFQFKIHEETQVRKVYALESTGKPGPFLHRSPTPDQSSGAPAGPLRPVSHSRRGQIVAEHYAMPKFADYLSNMLLVDVVDDTHLDGLYDLQLDWNSDETNSSSVGAVVDPASDKPSIFTAVREQLGLKLTPSKGPVKVWVIDHVELPSEN
jgi:uncharacterized protein (TIGR03435 family)